MRNEPVVTQATVLALLQAIVVFTIAFEIWEPTANQIAAVEGLIGIVFTIGLAVWARNRVTPVTNS